MPNTPNDAGTELSRPVEADLPERRLPWQAWNAVPLPDGMVIYDPDGFRHGKPTEVTWAEFEQARQECTLIDRRELGAAATPEADLPDAALERAWDVGLRGEFIRLVASVLPSVDDEGNEASDVAEGMADSFEAVIRNRAAATPEADQKEPTDG